MSVFLAVSCGYAITRHKLFDIRIIIQRGAIYTVLLATIIVSYLVIVNSIEIFSGETRKFHILLGAGLTTVLGIFGVPVIERTFRRASDQLFFKDHYDYAAAVHELSEILYTHIELADIMHESEEALARILRVTFVYIALFEAIPRQTQSALIVPITLEGLEIASIHLGEKRSGDPYTKRDLQLLSTFAYQAATALSRARLYAEIQEYATMLERKVEERTEELRLAHESQRRMVIDIAHNLQTPLTVFRGKIEELKKVMPHDKDISQFEYSLSSLSSFMYDLLSLAALEQVDEEDFVSIDLSSILNDIADEVSIIGSSSGITVRSEIVPNIRMIGNEKRLREAIMNIMSNAIKYIGAEGTKEIRFSLSTQDDTSIITITDSGIGIPPSDIGYIFDRCYRSPSVPHHIKGTGLGLAIVKRIIESQRGTIDVESVVGKGTTFRIIFPIFEK